MSEEPPTPRPDRVRAMLSWAILGGGCVLMTAITTSVLWIGTTRETLQMIVREHFRALYGIPAMSICATLLVFLFQATTRDEVEFDALGFRFRGAAGPLVLFVLCFLAFTISLALLW